MATTNVVLYKDDDGTTPVLDWLDGLQPDKVRAKCLVLVELLQQEGQQLRRPHADYLRDGIYELRAHHGTVQYRLAYFFHGKTAVISHGFIKKGSKVPDKEIDRAIRHKDSFTTKPKQHTHEED